MSSLPNQPPASLKPVSHYLKVALEHDSRDKVIAYWARFAAVQKSLTIDKSSPEAKMFVIKLLEWLETQKRELAGNEAITIEAAGEAHIENYALKLFSWADQSDRSGTFNKNVVKAFYTAGILFDILESLRPPLTEEFQSARKYSKWKAAYIHNCLKNGETPVPGPEANEDEEGAGGFNTDNAAYGFVNPAPPPAPQDNSWSNFPAESNSTEYTTPEVPYGGGAYSTPQQNSYVAPPYTPPVVPQVSGSGTNLSVEQIAKAQKYCKWAGSALNFDDVNNAIENLEKALHLLKTGQEL